MGTNKITGGFPVVGKQPGETVTDDELEGLNVTVLIEAGCITPTKARKGDSEEQ